MLKIIERFPLDSARHSYLLMHGEITHGIQLADPRYRQRVTTYYVPRGGAGLALNYHPRRWNDLPAERALRVGAVGMGTGTVAAYGIPGDFFRFYEINPQVIAFSAGKHPFFTFLRDSHAQTDVVEGDARISLERERESGGFEGFDVLILDAFNGDAIPIHMLTREAFRLYLDRLRDANGIIAVHITNRMLDLAPVLAAIANEFELHGIEIDSPSMGDSVLESRWVLLSRSNPVLTTPYSDLNFKPLRSDRTELWTDQYSSLFGVLIR